MLAIQGILLTNSCFLQRNNDVYITSIINKKNMDDDRLISWTTNQVTQIIFQMFKSIYYVI
jgi:hypothetical protein